MRPFQPVRGSNRRRRARNASVDGHRERFVEIALDRGGPLSGLTATISVPAAATRAAAPIRAVMLACVLGLRDQAWPASEPCRFCRALRTEIENSAIAITANETAVVDVPSA
jgi:hypothetical protein